MSTSLPSPCVPSSLAAAFASRPAVPHAKERPPLQKIECCICLGTNARYTTLPLHTRMAFVATRTSRSATRQAHAALIFSDERASQPRTRSLQGGLEWGQRPTSFVAFDHGISMDGGLSIPFLQEVAAYSGCTWFNLGSKYHKTRVIASSIGSSTQLPGYSMIAFNEDNAAGACTGLVPLLSPGIPIPWDSRVYGVNGEHVSY